jgi:hypothetical protein
MIRTAESLRESIVPMGVMTDEREREKGRESLAGDAGEFEGGARHEAMIAWSLFFLRLPVIGFFFLSSLPFPSRRELDL